VEIQSLELVLAHASTVIPIMVPDVYVHLGMSSTRQTLQLQTRVGPHVVRQTITTITERVQRVQQIVVLVST
jgi:hypothetical protein